VQAGGFIGALIAIIVTVALLGWWLGRLATRRVGGILGSFWRKDDRGFRNGLLIFAILTILISIVLVALAWVVVPRVANGDGAGWGSWADWSARLLIKLGIVLVAAAAVIAALNTAFVMVGTYRRRRILLNLDAGLSIPPSSATHQAIASIGLGSPARATGRRIVICCDGTGNRPDDEEEGLPATTNVWKLYRALICDEAQTTWYDAGVGTDTSSTSLEMTWSRRLLTALGARTGGQIMAAFSRLHRINEAATGAGITENIAQAYAEIVRQYRPGDQVYLIGFSRGAYTARCVAGVIERCGLLRQEYLRYAADVVYLYRTRPSPDHNVPVPATMVHGAPPIEFLGLFDTVGSLGVPLWGWWFQALPLPEWKNRALSTNPMNICRHVFHAMAMDERRSQFFPTPFAQPKSGHTHLEQVWFRGAHADIGGGYAETGLSDITLRWMADRAEQHGLRFRPDAFVGLRPNPLARLHDELTRSPSWRLFGSWPRWHPVPGENFSSTSIPPGDLHESVLERRDVLQRDLARPDFLRVPLGGAVEIEAQSHREWDRTGIVLDPGWYRVTYLGSQWRDAEAKPCGPYGQNQKDFGLVRSFSARWRRLPGEDWMRLCITIAHPRDWPLKELGLKDLLRYLYVQDPKELVQQIAPIGRDLSAPGDAVWLHNGAASGLLYLFANDLWLTAGNNAGAVHLRIEHAQRPTNGEPCWSLGKDGYWQRP
jgi:uncharacterized protein (DUF2235 family)